MIDDVTRRQAVGLAAVAGAMGFVGLPQVDARVDDKPKSTENPMKPEDRDKAEKERILACGLTEAEADCWVLLANAVGKFFALPKLHPMDDHEVAHATHIIQHKLLSRPAYRRYLELAKGEKKK